MRILTWSDFHAPAGDLYLLKHISDYAKHFKPDIVVVCGDLCDHRAWSRFLKSPEDENPSLELERTDEQIAKVHELFPNITILQGNHDSSRILKKAAEVGIPRKMILLPQDRYNYKGWTWYEQNKPLVLNSGGMDIAFIHGDETVANPSVRAARYGKSVVAGHSHQISLHYMKTFDKVMFSAEIGCVIDTNASNFSYAAKNPRQSMLGFATIEAGVISLIPLC